MCVVARLIEAVASFGIELFIFGTPWERVVGGIFSGKWRRTEDTEEEEDTEEDTEERDMTEWYA